MDNEAIDEFVEDVMNALVDLLAKARALGIDDAAAKELIVDTAKEMPTE